MWMIRIHFQPSSPIGFDVHRIDLFELILQKMVLYLGALLMLCKIRKIVKFNKFA